MKFQIVPVDDRLRFQSSEGWLEIKAQDGRALVMGGTFDATVPEVFGSRIWHLLRDVMPELGLKVCQVSFPAANTWLERIFVSAGFSKDGTLRAWAPNFQDVAIYSILDNEVKYEAQDAPRYEVNDGPTTPATTDGPLDGEHAGASGGNQPGAVQRDGPDDGIRSSREDTRRADKSDGSPISSTRPGDEASA